MDGRFISYLRVSTGKQERSGLGLEAQRQAVEDYLNGGSWKLLDEFVEVESGKRSDRPELARALAACRKRKATLVIARLDRLGRNVHFISGLMQSGVPFLVCDRPNAKPFELHIYAALAEEETRAIPPAPKLRCRLRRPGVSGSATTQTAMRRHAWARRPIRSGRVNGSTTSGQ
jgi:DNA invertase Pin-like site-specific DNA recombinase